MLFTVWVEAADRAELQDLVNCPDVPATVANAGAARRGVLEPADTRPRLRAADRGRHQGPETELAALRRARAELTDPWFSGVRVDCDDEQRWLLIDRSGVRRSTRR